MAAQNYEADSIPEKGVQVTLRNNANLSTGGTATDVTDHVHPELAATAVAAAQMVGLDVCGIDLVSENVYEPLDKQGGCIVEVRSEEHTSELQSLMRNSYAVFCLKKK